MSIEYKYRRHFVDYVRQRIDELELPAWYVGYYSEISDATFRQYMKGIRLPAPIKLIMIAELLKCTVNDLLGFDYYNVSDSVELFDSGRDTKYVMAYFGNNLSRIMIGDDVSVVELASRSGLSTYVIQQYIDGKVLPDISILIELCESLNCTPSELLGY